MQRTPAKKQAMNARGTYDGSEWQYSTPFKRPEEVWAKLTLCPNLHNARHIETVVESSNNLLQLELEMSEPKQEDPQAVLDHGVVMKREYSFQSEVGRPDVYVCETGDADDGKIRLQFVNDFGVISFDYEPKELFSIGSMVYEAMASEGYCCHGEKFEKCNSCMLRTEDDSVEGGLRKALLTCVHFLEKGVKPRMMAQWPLIESELPKVVSRAMMALATESV